MEVGLEVKLDQVLSELVRMARSDPAEALDESGCVLPLQEMPIDVRRAIASVEVEETWAKDADGRKVRSGRIVKLRWWPKDAALQQLMRHLGAFAKDNALDVNVRHSYAELLEAMDAKRRAAAAIGAPQPMVAPSMVGQGTRGTLPS